MEFHLLSLPISLILLFAFGTLCVHPLEFPENRRTCKSMAPKIPQFMPTAAPRPNIFPNEDFFEGPVALDLTFHNE